ncbi:DUF262 domain-containing protein [Pseudonocardia aurantiaca]|uniref:DUF262 domain-containing protein n=1 Tax=Pseudonocardia aurantiaca TaxID=75290 RepID=A0ABW4FXS0_9PSEU
MSSVMPHYRTITQLLQSRTFAIDEYQREYKWETQNIEELLVDLQTKFLASYQEGDSPRAATGYADYFLGSIIVTMRGGKHYLVDGQQRVTSLTLLLIYLYREAKERQLPVVSTIQPLIYSDNYGEETFNLDIKERIPVLRALFAGEDYQLDGKDESVQTILARYRDIERIDPAAELGDALSTFIYWLLGNVGLIEIVAETDQHAYAIFETMNDRGKPLSPTDMMKASLLAPVDTDDERSRANREWRRTLLELSSWSPNPDPDRGAVAIKSWLRAQYAESIRDRRAGSADRDWETIGTVFHRWLRDNADRIGAGDSKRNVRLMTEEFPFFARAYLRILEASRTYTPGLEAVFYNAHNEFTWQNTVLLAPLSSTDDETTVRRKIAAMAIYLDIWVMRRVVNYVRVGYSSVSYAMWLLCRDVRGVTLPELIPILERKLATDDDVSFEGSASRGRHGIAALGLNQFSRRYVYHLLARLTAYVETQSGKPDLFASYVDRTQKNASDIEHIWANVAGRYESHFASPHEFWETRDGIGALLLLPADVNRSFQAKPFEEKAPHYAKQNLFAASLTGAAYQHQPQFQRFIEREGLPFRPYDYFGIDQQRERTDLVLQLANRIWSPTRLDAVLEAQACRADHPERAWQRSAARRGGR